MFNRPGRFWKPRRLWHHSQNFLVFCSQQNYCCPEARHPSNCRLCCFPCLGAFKRGSKKGVVSAKIPQNRHRKGLLFDENRSKSKVLTVRHWPQTNELPLLSVPSASFSRCELRQRISDQFLPTHWIGNWTRILDRRRNRVHKFHYSPWV